MYGNIVNRLGGSTGVLTAKIEQDGRPSRFGRTWGSADSYRDVNGSDTDGCHRYCICFHIFYMDSDSNMDILGYKYECGLLRLQI
jgi:hypothetical protein